MQCIKVYYGKILNYYLNISNKYLKILTYYLKKYLLSQKFNVSQHFLLISKNFDSLSQELHLFSCSYYGEIVKLCQPIIFLHDINNDK